MKKILRIFVCSSIIFISIVYAEAIQQEMPPTSKGKVVIVDESTGAKVLVMPGQSIVKSTGETVVNAESVQFKVRVKIETHEVQIGKTSDGRPDVIRSACTYSRYPCSVVDYIDISVNDRPLVVPRSVFCDLADVNTAEVQIGQKETMVVLTGGDASESYIVKIEFDTEQIKRMSKYWSEYSEDEPVQEIIYHKRILKDE